MTLSKQRFGVRIAWPRIDPGRRWTQSLVEQLQSTDVGLICVTRESLKSDWLMFARVIPICIDIGKADLPSPLAMFQSIALGKDGWRQLMRTLAEADPDCMLTEPQVDTVFEKLWAPIDAEVRKGLASLREEPAPDFDTRMSDREVLDELLVLARVSREPTRADILEALKKWELGLRRTAAHAQEVSDRYDAPTGQAALRLEESADTLSSAQALISGIFDHAP